MLLQSPQSHEDGKLLQTSKPPSLLAGQELCKVRTSILQFYLRLRRHSRFFSITLVHNQQQHDDFPVEECYAASLQQLEIEKTRKNLGICITQGLHGLGGNLEYRSPLFEACMWSVSCSSQSSHKAKLTPHCCHCGDYIHLCAIQWFSSIAHSNAVPRLPFLRALASL